MKKIKLKPGESVEIESSGTYGQNIIAEVMDDGVICYRIKHNKSIVKGNKEK